MTMNTNKVLIWLKEFESTWLPQNISKDTHLFQSITNKFHELEQILIRENNQDENDLSLKNEYQCAKSSDTGQIVLSTPQQQPERSLPTPPDINNQIEDKNEKHENFSRPAILIKRISLTDAQHFLPPAWKITKSKRGRKKSKKKLPTINSNKKTNKKITQTNKVLISSTQDETANNSNSIRKSTRLNKNTKQLSTLSLISIQSTNDNKKKSKRKLRAIDAEDDDLYTLGNLSQKDNTNGNTDCEQISRYIGQNGILSQTRKINETTTTTFDDDFTIKLSSRQSNKDKTLTTKFSNQSNDILTESSITDGITIINDPIDDEQIFQDVIENHDNDSLFTTLDITHNKTLETNSILNNNSIINYGDCIEDISNDGIDPPPSSSPNLNHFSLIT